MTKGVITNISFLTNFLTIDWFLLLLKFSYFYVKLEQQLEFRHFILLFSYFYVSLEQQLEFRHALYTIKWLDIFKNEDILLYKLIYF